MTVYLASPVSQQQMEHVAEMPVLLSFAIHERVKCTNRYQQTFSRILVDSGAYSEMNSGAKVDGHAYRDWAARWEGHADAVAGLDDIRGNWKRSLRNYERFGGFPTIHDSDPIELIQDLIPIQPPRARRLDRSRTRSPRQGKEAVVRRICDLLPEDLHIHGWALRAYTHVRRLDSVDSTHWWRDAMKIRKDLPFLTYGEALEISVKRYKRWKRTIVDPRRTKPGLLRNDP